MPRKILVIEDDKDIARLLEVNLQEMGYDVTLSHDGSAGLALATSQPYDLLILDLMLPGMGGLEICTQIRSRPTYIPILMLTCKSSEIDRVLGLEIGADDYVTKPFSVRELMARVKALFRRVKAMESAPADAKKVIRAGELVVDMDKREVTLQGEPVQLTAKEFDLLLQFVRHPGRVYSREQLLNSVWGYAYSGYEHTVNSHINRLRAKIESDSSTPRYILTVWGVGYKFVDHRG